MDIPDESPELTKPKAGKLPIVEGDIIVATLAGDLMSSQGTISALSYMKARHIESEEMRLPTDGGRSDLPATGVEAFLLSDHPSHLTKIAELEDQIQKCRRAVDVIDETDFSGRSLYDFVPEETREELENQLISLKERSNIRASVEAELSSCCGDIWDDYRLSKEKTAQERREFNETLLLGPDASPDELKTLRSCKEIEDAEVLGELIGLEKARLCARALVAEPRDYPEKAAEAERILGPEFELIKAQVTHMENMLEKDWAKADGEAIINPSSGKDLLCEEIKRRMEPVPDKDGNPTEERQISKGQLDAMEGAYLNAISRKGDSETPRDRNNRKLGFILAACEIIELGKRSKTANLLKTIRELDNPSITAEETDPKRRKLWEWLKDHGLARVGKAFNFSKKGVAKCIKAAPQALVMGTIGGPTNWVKQAWTKNKEWDRNRYGSHEHFVSLIRETFGEINHMA